MRKIGRKPLIFLFLLLPVAAVIMCEGGKSGDTPLLPIPSPPIAGMYPIDIDFNTLPNGPLSGPAEIEGVEVSGEDAIVTEGIILLSPGELFFIPPDEVTETAVMLNSQTASSMIKAVDKNGTLIAQTTTWEYGDYYFFTVSSDSIPQIRRIEVVGPNTEVVRAIFSRPFAHIEFEKSSELAFATSASSIISGDVDGDGAMDIVVTDPSSSNVVIGYGDGSGNILDIENILTSSAPSGIVLGGFNNDTFPDIAVSLPNENSVGVFINNGGAFSAGAVYPACVNTTSLSAGDVNNDGWVDIAAGCDDGAGILLNAGDGTFMPYEAVPALDAPIAVTVLADMDMNGTMDLVSALKTPPSIEVWKGNNSGAAGFTKFQSIPLPSQPLSLLVQALNWDRYKDSISALAGTPNFSSWVNQKDGSLTRAQYFQVGKGSPPAGLALGDINADGFDDMAFAEENGDISIFVTDLFKQLQLIRVIQTGATLRGIIISDVNGDKKGDIVALDNAGWLRVYLNRSY